MQTHTKRFLFSSLVFLILLTSTSSAAFAQAFDNGSLSGVVTDPNGAAASVMRKLATTARGG